MNIFQCNEFLRLKVIRFIKEWVEKRTPSFQAIHAQVSAEFLPAIEAQFPEEHKMLDDLLNNTDDNISSRDYSPSPRAAKRGSIRNIISSGPLTSRSSSSSNLVPTSSWQLKLKDIEEIAQQLLFLDWNFFKQIQLQEFEGVAWTKAPEIAAKLSPKVIKLIDHFNRLVFWISTKILTAGCNADTNIENVPSPSPTPPSASLPHPLMIKKQAKAIRKFVKLGRRSLQLRNYNVVMAVLGGLNHGSISRLKAVWGSLPNKVKLQLNELDALMDSKQNYKNYRQSLAKDREDCRLVPAPIVPYLGLYLRDLFFAEEGNPNFVPATPTTNEEEKTSPPITSVHEIPKLINVSKLEMVGSIYEEIWHIQSLECNVKSNPEMQAYFSDIKALGDQELYEYSKALTASQAGSNTTTLTNTTYSSSPILPTTQRKTPVHRSAQTHTM